MDASEATRIVFTRIQTLDPANAAKIMGLLLLQDHGEKEMIRLAFGPESLIRSLVIKARNDLGVSPAFSAPVSPSPGYPLSSEDLNNGETSPFYNVGGDFGDELAHQEPFYSDGWGVNGHRRRSYSASAYADLASLTEDGGAAGFEWKPCMYFARGFCKNGSGCRFVHGLVDEGLAAGSKIDAAMEQQYHELLLRSKSPRIGLQDSNSQLMASVFPYSPTGSPSASIKGLNYLLQQQNESQRAVTAAAAATLMLGGDESHKFFAKSRLDRGDLIPGSRQIYLTFPADSTFREEDVSNYFSIYGPVQDVRIPYQQKRMFGFVTFAYPETVKLILAKGNPHFVCDCRVLVKPYKEKGKVADKFRKQQLGERLDFSACTSPTGLGFDNGVDPYDLQQLGARLLYNSGNNQQLLLRRKLEEQQQATELQKAIELQNRRFMGLQLIDLKHRMSLPPTFINTSINNNTPTISVAVEKSNDNYNNFSAALSTEEKSPTGSAVGEATEQKTVVDPAVEESNVEGSTKNVSEFQKSDEHYLPDSPFASPSKSSIAVDPFSNTEVHIATSDANATPYITNNGNSNNNHLISPTFLPPPSPTLNTAPFNSCFFQRPRFSSNHGAIGM